MTRLINAKLRLQRAREACPHWDQESDGEGHECCYDVDDASRALRRAKQTAAKGER
jgi:hypothetical protein